MLFTEIHIWIEKGEKIEKKDSKYCVEVKLSDVKKFNNFKSNRSTKIMKSQNTSSENILISTVKYKGDDVMICYCEILLIIPVLIYILDEYLYHTAHFVMIKF